MLSTATLYVTLATVPFLLTVTFAVVPAPFTKFTVSYGFTKSLALLFSCKFQPAFNTSPTVAALFTLTLSASIPKTGAVPDVVGACVSVFAPAKLPATFVTAKLPASIPSLLMVTGPTFRLPSVVKSTSFFNEYVNSLPFCFKCKLLPAMNFTSSPAFTCSVVGLSTSPVPVLPDITFQLTLLIAS